MAIPHNADADSPGEIERKALGALSRLYRHNPTAAENGRRAYAMLVFPEDRKIALGIGIETATGVLFEEGKSLSFHNLTGFSGGLEMGIRKFSCAILFETEEVLNRFRDSHGFDIGCSPSLVIADGILPHTWSSTNRQPGVLVYVFNQTGLMIDMGVHISKITEYEPGD